ncbi:Phosphodi esterase yfcE [Salmonella enterica subsp. enterica]|nr:Phosphodi esterase yfcE [Salmonella enterica subsp. enterica]
MKLMFASDIHGSLPATERVLERFAQSGARWLVILGDVLNHGPRNALPEGYAPAQVAERLNAVATQIIAVRGNCDSEVDQMLLHFPITAPWQQILTQERRLFLTHGHLSGRRICPLCILAMCWSMVIRICRWRNSRKDCITLILGQ